MLCEVPALPFQAHANYGTRSIDFNYKLRIIKYIAVDFYLSQSYKLTYKYKKNNNISSI